MAHTPWRYILPLIAALSFGGCRDRYLSTSYEEGRELPASERIFYADLNRGTIVSMTVDGKGTDVVRTTPRELSQGRYPLLSSAPREGMMPVVWQGSSYPMHQMYRLDGSTPDYLWQIGVYPRRFVDGSFVLSHDAELYAMFTIGTDSSQVPILPEGVYLQTGALRNTTSYDIRITDPEHQPISSPRFSPTAARVAFLDRWGELFVELVTMDIDGGNRKVWFGAVESQDLTSPRLEWSPDGTTVAIAGVWMANAIALVDQRTSVISYLSTAPFDEPRGVSWSPDGKSLAFSGIVNSNEEVCTIEVATGILRNITRSDTASEHSPQWSPDGRRLAWVYRYRQDGTGAPVVHDLQLGTFRFYPARTAAVFWAR